jgi:hypothetical protein
MGVRIEPIPNSVRVRITGDIETTLSVPFEDDDRFMVGLSDGTLLIGFYDDHLRCRFDVARDGAGIIQFEDGAAVVNWKVEWATICTYNAEMVELPDPKPMPLFPDLEEMMH